MMRIAAIFVMTLTTVLFTAAIACNTKSAERSRRDVDSLSHLNCVKKKMKGSIEDSIIVSGSEIGKAAAVSQTD
jgi:hypothetical protein